MHDLMSLLEINTTKSGEPRKFYTWEMSRWNPKLRKYEPCVSVQADSESHALDVVDATPGLGRMFQFRASEPVHHGHERGCMFPSNVLGPLYDMADNLRCSVNHRSEIEQRSIMDGVYALAFPLAHSVAHCNEIMAIFYDTPIWLVFRLHREYLDNLAIKAVVETA
jgi:hypothetical protein